MWLAPTLIEARWIREGLASDVAARAAADLDVDVPFDPVAEATAAGADAFPLDAWPPSADPATEAYGHAASWAFVAELREAVGDEALRQVLARAAASVGPVRRAPRSLSPPRMARPSSR